MKEVYLSGQEGTTVTEEKPKGKHVSILATDLKVLKDKKNVIVVVP